MNQTASGDARSARRAPLTVFLHVPHAAGQTFESILLDNFPDGVRNIGHGFGRGGGFTSNGGADDAVRLADDARAVIGAVSFAVRHRLPPDAQYVTFLRDPIERTLSQYHQFRNTNRDNLPGDGSLEATLAAGNLIYDNLQTRILSDEAEPLGEVDDRLLEQAKENLRSGLAAFGIVERFDESLVLMAPVLGLASILYVQQRVTQRLRGADVPADMLRSAERYNRYDIELYRFAADLLEQRLAEQGVEFHVELAAVRAARDDESTERPAAATADELWPLLVRARADDLCSRLDSAQARSKEAEELRSLLDEVRAQLGELNDALSTAATERDKPAAPRRNPVATRVATMEKARERTRRQLKQAREGGQPGEVERVERKIEAIDERLVRARARLDATAAEEPARPQRANRGARRKGSSGDSESS